MNKAIVIDDAPIRIKSPEPCTYPLCPISNMVSLNCKGCTSEQRKKIREDQEKIKMEKMIHLVTTRKDEA